MGREIWKPGNMLYPLPVVMVSCRRPNEKANIVTVAWTGTICSDPAMLYISLRKSRYSYDIIKETGEFVVCLATKELCHALDFCGVKSGRDIDKFAACGLHELEMSTVSAPGIAESPVCIECKVKEIVELGSHDMFISDVTAVQADDRYMNADGKFDLALADPIVYSHGDYYTLNEKIGKFGYSVKKNRV